MNAYVESNLLILGDPFLSRRFSDATAELLQPIVHRNHGDHHSRSTSCRHARVRKQELPTGRGRRTLGHRSRGVTDQ